MNGDGSVCDLVEITRAYYDSADADSFYFRIWGGEHIHIGLYGDGVEDIALASRRTVDAMACRVPRIGPGVRVLDLGAGYGGAARQLAAKFACHVTALNISSTENVRSRDMTQAAGLGHLVDVLDGSYEDIAAPDASFDVVWSQDAILHSARKERVFAEVARVLKSGGEFILTDPMESDDVASGRRSRAELQPVLDRIHLASMGSFQLYARLAADNGLETVGLSDLTPHLVRHYAQVRASLAARRSSLTAEIDPAFIDRMLAGLDHWVQAGERGSLAWGMLHFCKP